MHLLCTVLYFYLWSVCLTVPSFSALSHKGHNFRKKFLNPNHVFLLYNFSRSTNNSAIYLHRSSRKKPVIFVKFYQHSKKFFSTDFSKHPQISDFKNILPVGAQLFHADRQMDRKGQTTKGQTDMTQLLVAFRSFVNVPNWGPTVPRCSTCFFQSC
jgi:hypothetical protein